MENITEMKIKSLLNSTLSDSYISKESNINKDIISSLRKGSITQNLDSLSFSTIKDLEKIYDNFKITPTAHKKLIDWSNEIITSSDNAKHYTVRVRADHEHGWEYCSIAKNEEKNGVITDKSIHIPLFRALNILDIEYIPHFTNYID